MPSDKDGLGALTVALLAGFFSLFGATARVLQQWPNFRYPAALIGSLMANTLSGMVIGLIVWESWGISHPTWLLASTAVGGWTGSFLLDMLAKKWILPRMDADGQKQP